jgi:Tfp pilus assembly protein PilV
MSSNISIGFNSEANKPQNPALVRMCGQAMMLKHKNQKPGIRGFTIMEVALAATVLAFTLVGTIGVVESGSQMLDLSRKQTLAAQILHGEIDQLRLQSWAAIAGEPPANTAFSTFYSGTQVGYSGPSGLLTTPGNGYPATTTLTSSNDPSFARFVASYPQTAHIFTLTRTVTCIEPAQNNSNPTAYASAPLLLQVTFTISWKGVSGVTYTRSSTTLVGSNGLSVAYQRS